MRLRTILILLAILIVAGGVYFFINRQSNTPPAQSKVYIWNIDDDQLIHVSISLPRVEKSQAFIKISNDDKFPWFFDDPQKSPVDNARWGGGIPLLLSGPGADRIIAENATHEQLDLYGFNNPSMVITLTLENGDILKVTTGDSTPNGQNYYVRLMDSTSVATVDSSWYQVLERLVLEPPYVSTK